MMKNIGKMVSFVLLTTMLVGGLVWAEEAKKQPVGKVSIEEKQFGLILGGSMGTGILTFEGKDYPFKLKGLSAGINVGISKMSAVGEVYDLKKVSDFPGTYTKFQASVALGGGVGGLHMSNEHGVVMSLSSRTQGVDLNIGNMTGVTVTME
ncbi:MAG: DUF1134 domain-containing protein [Phycisphaerales bacterium]|nr:DUF1134 domain-containing protein [Phycisphaerales bacterium]